MTFCFAYSQKGLSLVAADTRVTFGEEPLAASDDREFTIHHDAGVLTLPEKYRKIQLIGGTWYTAAGDYLVSRELLARMKGKSPSDRESALRTINAETDDVVRTVVAETHLPINGRYNVRILAAPFGVRNDRAWAAQLYQESGAAVIGMNPLIANWPLSIDGAKRSAAEIRFLRSIASGTHVADNIRAAAQMITAGDGAPDCSRYAQIGLTIYLDPERSKSLYIQGVAADLANMSNDEIMARCETAQ